MGERGSANFGVITAFWHRIFPPRVRKKALRNYNHEWINKH